MAHSHMYELKCPIFFIWNVTLIKYLFENVGQSLHRNVALQDGDLELGDLGNVKFSLFIFVVMDIYLS